MKVNPSKTMRRAVSRSPTVTPRISALGFNDVVLVEYPHLEIIGVTFDAKLTFECHPRIVA